LDVTGPARGDQRPAPARRPADPSGPARRPRGHDFRLGPAPDRWLCLWVIPARGAAPYTGPV